MTMKTILLLDFGSIWWRQWHASGDEAVSYAAQRTVGQVRALAGEYDHTAVCLDAPGRNWRHDRWDGYKANREKHDALAIEQMRRTISDIDADGFPMFQAIGFEADDVIASAVHLLTGDGADLQVTIGSADKDLLQLLRPGIDVIRIGKGEKWDVATATERLGVRPDQVCDYLALVGDTSDNIPGIPGCGAKTAAKLLREHGSIDAIVAAVDSLTPKLRESLKASQADGVLQLSRDLVKLRHDISLDVSLIFEPRVPHTNSSNDEEFSDMQNDATEAEIVNEDGEVISAAPTAPTVPDLEIPPAPPSGAHVTAPAEAPPAAKPSRPSELAAPQTTTALALAPATWRQSLEPRSMDEARTLARHIIDSRLFAAYGTPQAALLTIMAGREFGLGAIASLRSFHIVEGKPTMSAQLMMAMCLTSPICKTFRILRSECNEQQAVVLVQRADWDSPERYPWTAEDAEKAGLTGKTTWKRYPRQMLTNRCIAEAARFAFPELMANCYCPEDFGAVENAA